MRRSFRHRNSRLSCELGPGGSIQLNRQAEQVSAAFGNPPASCPRYLGHQLANMQTFEEAPHCSTGTSLELSLLGIAEERFPDVGIAKTTRHSVALQHGREQAHVLAP